MQKLSHLLTKDNCLSVLIVFLGKQPTPGNVFFLLLADLTLCLLVLTADNICKQFGQVQQIVFVRYASCWSVL